MNLTSLVRRSALALIVVLAACAGDGSESSSETDLAARVCASSRETVPGIDVSAHQAKVDFAAVKAAGKEFVIVRTGDGLSRDKKFKTNWPAVKKAGLVRGIYQYFRPSKDPIKQAELMLSMVREAGGFAPGDLPPVIDLENNEGLSAAAVTAAAKKWLSFVGERTSTRPIVYTSLGFSPKMNGAELSSYPLWVANYTTKCPLMPTGWTRWTLWQSSESGRVAGVTGNVDLNVFQGSLQELAALGMREPVTIASSADEADPPSEDEETETAPVE